MAGNWTIPSSPTQQPPVRSWRNKQRVTGKDLKQEEDPTTKMKIYLSLA